MLGQERRLISGFKERKDGGASIAALASQLAAGNGEMKEVFQIWRRRRPVSCIFGAELCVSARLTLRGIK